MIINYLPTTWPLPGHYLATTYPLPTHYLATTYPPKKKKVINMVKINNIEINKNKTQIYKTINIYYNDIYDICLKILKKFKINLIQNTNYIKYQVVYNNSHFIVYEHNKHAIFTHFNRNVIETDISIIKYICDKYE